MAEAGFVHRDRCAIVGIGATDFSVRSGRSELSLATEAALSAIVDGGFSPSDIDGIVRCDKDTVRPNDLVESLGLRQLNYFGESGPGGVAPCAMIGQAVGAILSGQAETVLVFRALNGRSGKRVNQGRPTDSKVGGMGSYDEFFTPYGLLTAGQTFALIARRHMIEYGTDERAFGRIAMACRARANANPAAQMRAKSMAMEDYLEAPMISNPLRLLDYCIETDGACAAIVTSVDRARDRPKPPALIRAVAQGSLPSPQPGMQFPELLRETTTSLHAKPTAETLYRRAGIGPGDIDVAQIYDCFTITVLLQLEDYGFCGPGEGGEFVMSGEIDLGGRLPINTAGGNLSEGYIHGMNHVLEGVRQIRGESTSQVPDAAVCLVTSTALRPGSAMILRAS